MTKEEIANLITNGWAEYVALDRHSATDRDYIYASQWKPCTRRLVYDMTESAILPEFDSDTLARFKRGKDRERDMMTDLARVGRLVQPEFEVVGGQEAFTLKDRLGRKVVSGKVDARIRFSGDHNGHAYPIEAKSWSPMLTAKIHAFDDVLDGYWTRSGGYQLLMYMLGMKDPLGFLLLDRPGLPLPLPVDLEMHLDKAEAFWKQSEEAVAYVRDGGDIPDFYDDPAECRRCPFFGAVCNPPIGSQEQVGVIQDEQTLQDIERFGELRTILEACGLDEFEKLDADLKKRLRGVEMALAGNYLVRGKWGKQSSVVLTPELEAEWREIKASYTRTDPKGKFYLKIEKIGPEVA